MPVEPAELAELLELLLDASVEFILVGGGAAVIHGAPVTTQDIDIVHRREVGNVDRPLQVLSRRAGTSRAGPPASEERVKAGGAVL